MGVCVSDPFEVKKIANALLESPEKSNVTVSELETLFQLIKNTFSGKRFLLVFDDVWTETYSDWKPFRDSLKNGAPGSIILVTTRKDMVARVVGSDYMHTLGLMSDPDCWLILKRVALSKRSELCEKVEKVGKKITEKCKGLPLAARILGSLLQLKDTVQEWQEVLNSKIWQTEEASVNLFPHFYLSYRELSPQLKRCFSYCAVFPKNTIIDVERLIRLWMAQGYLGPPSQTGDDRRNMKGRECFKNLAMRSFFQELKRWDIDEEVIVSCKMHDIVHDFVQFLTKNECRTFDEVDCQKIGANGGYLFKDRARHLTLLGKIKSINSSIVVEIGNVRSLFISSYVGELPQDLCSSMKSVRSLVFSDCQLRELPPELGTLIYLRHLDVSKNPLKELPETICDLHYLESLDVSECDVLQLLPQRIGDLAHLRYLLNLGTGEVKQMPPGLEKLTSLCSLTRFIADGAPLNDMTKLENLTQLEELNIFVGGHIEFNRAQLGGKPHLQRLRLKYFQGEGFDIENASSIEVMEPPPNLQALAFSKYPRPQLPKWIVVAESLINNLTSLSLEDSDHISSLPALGKLSSLQFLQLSKISSLKHIGREIFGLPDHLQTQGHHDDDDVKIIAFPSLKTLSIWFLHNWETWEDISEEDEEKINNGTVSFMPRLENLRIRGCENLEALPHRLLRKASSIKELSALSCTKLQSRYTLAGADWMEVSQIPQVNIEGMVCSCCGRPLVQWDI